jgi:hypothetical protein
MHTSLGSRCVECTFVRLSISKACARASLNATVHGVSAENVSER